MTDEDEEGALDGIVERIQRAIDGEEKRVFSPQALREARSPSNLRVMESAHGRSSKTGSCGDTIRFFVMLGAGRIADASFLTDGCGATVACGSMLTKMVRGLTVAEAMGLRDQALLDELGGLPEENLHCARLAVAAMHRAVIDATSTTGVEGRGAPAGFGERSDGNSSTSAVGRPRIKRGGGATDAGRPGGGRCGGKMGGGPR